VPWTGAPGAFAPGFTWNGAVGLAPDIPADVTVANLLEGAFPATVPVTTAGTCPAPTANTVTAWTDAPLGLPNGATVIISPAVAEGNTPTPPGYAGTWTISCISSTAGVSPDGVEEYPFQYLATGTGLAADTGNDLAAYASSPPTLDGHVDPRPIMDVGVMNGNIPGPLITFDEDDEFFLTLTNVGMIMRPDLFEQHTVHFHGYPNASSFYDGVPDASVAINIGASFTYYYLAPDAGTYFWHCHITPPEHLQMGMVGQLYVRPRQNRVPSGGNLYTYLGYQNGVSEPSTNPTVDLRTACNPSQDILCSATMPAINTGAVRPAAGTLCSGATVVSGTEGTTPNYVYNDGDGSSCYDVVYPMQMHGFDPNFHFVGMTFNPELFADMKDKYFLLNGRSYPDTIKAGPQATITSDGQMHYSQPLPSIINIPQGGKASLRLVNLSVAEYFTLQSLGVPMHEIGFNAKLLRDQEGNNTEFYTNSITLGGGESLDVILDASDDGCSTYLGTGCAAKLYPVGSTFYVYTSNLDMLSNDAENFGGMMTEVHICNSVTSDTYGNVCN
jgi:FtsP/CotA-like multicopper oxidase with cupredoxin domain